MTRYAQSCIVTLKSTKCVADGTGSGIMIDTVQGFIITHASLLGAIVLKDQHLQNVVLSQLDSLSEEIVGHVSVEVILERSSRDNSSKHYLSQDVLLSKYQSALVSSTITSRNPDLSTHAGSVVSLFKCGRFENALKHLTPQRDWQFTDTSDDGKLNNNVSLKEKHDAEVITFKLLPYCLLIKVDNLVPYKSALSVRSPTLCHIGEAAEICATPFGNLFPNVLVNSYSRGVISNLAGKNRCIILTDARCIPGSEGGPLYTLVDSNRCLTGMIVTSLCWKNSEWIGLSLACSIDEILENLATSGVSVKSARNTISSLWKHTHSMENISAMFENIALIKVDNSWGSGVTIDPVRKIVLTCSHVIKHGRSHTVNLKPKPNGDFLKCEVLWHSPPTEQFDLAVVKYSGHSQRHAATVSPGVPTEGSLVYVIGHGVFGAEHNLSPSVTVGVVSKVITVNQIPVMIQTTCAVHPGASGGALIDKHGHLVGIVVCNAKDVSSGACFPHVNLSIPMNTIWPVIHKYCSGGDVGVLNSLHLKNPAIDNMWTLGNETSVNQFISRL
ncbi:peroxisomal leader peptide-processing protease-like [Gigantopelta aegis]|uniref:peroxisomal leader peptide-processing protease-like n=1 Tax=Gigantopelta aegis TaxID=1735272 RepID=UPI001B88B51D|nr:peroxisomal leader peptide-processing protease-like [Gigantopelta aegis]XP_041365772.1 peroxisomal leader peptide-processing protease-like [Gigantopelta aegis]